MWILIIIGIAAIVSAGVIAYLIYKENPNYHWDGPVIVKKPAVYLYPTQDSIINVQLDINGRIVQSIPDYNNGWNVFVARDGKIENKYDYLFYEAQLNNLELPDEGWVVSSQDLDSWMNVNLIKLGLNEKEAEQFKEYWMKELPKSNYYEIKLLSQEFLKENMNLIVSGNPDTMIRLNFYFKALENPTQIKNPAIITPERNGFVVVEWGGILA